MNGRSSLKGDTLTINLAMSERNDSKAQLSIEDGTRVKSKAASHHVRPLLFIAAFLGLFAIGPLIATIFISGDKRQIEHQLAECKSNEGPKEEVCGTPHCVKMASMMIENMNTEINPCDNFYEYACGGWTKKYVIPEDRSSYSSLASLRNRLEIVLKGLFEQDISPSELSAVRKVKNYYKACIDLDTIDDKDSQPLIPFLEELGGWPVLGNNPGGSWSEISYNFEDLWAKIAGYSNNVLVEGLVFTDAKSSLQRVLYVDQAGLGMMSRDYYLKEKYLNEKNAYQKFMTDVALLLGADPAVAKKDMRDLLEFETVVANLTVPKTERRDNEALYNVYTLADLGREVPQINFRKYFETLLPADIVPLPEDERIINRSPEYIRRVAALIASTPPRVVANYLVWRITRYRITNLSQKFRDIDFAYDKVLSGTSAAEVRWRACSNAINGAMKFATGRMYVTEAFAGESKANTKAMIRTLKVAFKHLLEENNWMDEKTKEVAAQKSDAMNEQVGYPDWIMDDAAINKKYENYDFQSDDYFGNVVRKLKYFASESFSQLREPVDKEGWIVGPAIINAVYAYKNLIIFPAGILQPPLYHAESPAYLNYGGIGMIIGHEITHGFDDKGRQYDADGNLVQWWTNSSIASFKERTQCIIDQYSNYTIPENGLHLNGQSTQGENIADNGGLKETFLAYSTLIKETNETIKRLPGLNLTGDQMLFVNFAQMWCSLYREEGIINKILTDEHSHRRFRVIGPLHNNEEFIRVFNCPVDSYMNAKKKCVVW